MNSLKKIECKAVNIKLQAKEVWNLPEPFAFRGLFDEIMNLHDACVFVLIFVFPGFIFAYMCGMCEEMQASVGVETSVWAMHCKQAAAHSSCRTVPTTRLWEGGESA